MSDRVRIYRILIYEGERDWVDEQIQRREIKGRWGAPRLRRGTISEAIIGEIPEIMPGGPIPPEGIPLDPDYRDGNSALDGDADEYTR